MHNIILCAALLILGSVSASAQFYTITKETEILPEKQQKVVPDTLQRGLDAFESCKKAEKDSLAPEVPMKPLSELYARKVYARVSHEKASDKGTEGTTVCVKKALPALTIPNLYREIIRNGIRHPKIVLAQAILETGWFRSPLCRNRHNLFGIPKPGNTMSSTTGRKASGPTIPRCSISIKEETTCCGCTRLATRKIRGMCVK